MVPLSILRLLTWSSAYAYTLVVHRLHDKTKRTEMRMNILASPLVTSSLRLHTQTVELGPDTSRCMLDRRSFAPGSALLSSRAGYCRRNTSEQSTILPEIWQVLGVSVGKPRLPLSLPVRLLSSCVKYTIKIYGCPLCPDEFDTHAYIVLTVLLNINTNTMWM